jgi:hypothetical protein
MKRRRKKMTKYFMTGTPHEKFEIMMMLPPKCQPEGSGILAAHKYTADDCSCRYCTKAEKEKHRRRRAYGSSSFRGCAAAESKTHGELAACMAGDYSMKEFSMRIRRLLPPQTLTPFTDETHRERMASAAAAMNRESSPFISAVFLLSADPALWAGSRREVRNGLVRFSRINVQGDGQESDTLIQTAEDLYYGRCRLTMNDLTDPNVIGDKVFRLIISAFVIRRFGLPAGARSAGGLYASCKTRRCGET